MTEPNSTTSAQPIPAPRLVLDEAAQWVSFWPKVRDHAELSPDEALDLLATWAHLRRFEPKAVDAPARNDLDVLVAADGERIIASALGSGAVLADWHRGVAELEHGWAYVIEPEG